ncbi:Nucleic acid-binding OB-fold [Penicillium verhagenii]|uniref:Nucleic acid-binding OB-fold n=1 Tax=Penicillium verhagenii TaxID=1562060 RepID=UPI0025456D71|nr:Nucleic acid-binding OB-fold [Penicillium verhagenii]KAJ5934998.1 Nucleic acid-binding OB-fold [Penicillium verhagenii]
MAPNHILRAAMPIRSIVSSMAMTRATILPSARLISQSLRSASTTSTPIQEPITPSPASPSAQNLQRPALLRNYAYRLKTGTVESVGRMERTVRVTQRTNVWDKHIGKFYPKETRYLVSDPRDSLREGDVIEFSSGAPKSRHVHHVVERIITPFAVPIEDRPAVMSREQREQERERRWAEKYVRRESRRQGEEVDLVARAAAIIGEEAQTLSTAELIHRIHAGQERVGKLKQLVLERTAERPVEAVEE